MSCTSPLRRRKRIPRNNLRLLLLLLHPGASRRTSALRRQGLGGARALIMGQMSGVVEPVAGVIGAALVLSVQRLLPYMLAFAAGAMIYVVVAELIPESQSNERSDIMAIATLVGFSVMMVLDVALG